MYSIVTESLKRYKKWKKYNRSLYINGDIDLKADSKIVLQKPATMTVIIARMSWRVV
jgi:hypothetical protein